MTTYAQPYQSQSYQRSTYPPVQPPPSWVRPPYAGAPPIPAGVSVNPQQWQAGFWQMNPAYKQPANPQAQQQNAPWIPSHHWSQSQRHPQHVQQQQQQQPQSSVSQSSQQQQASYNPYKRVPKPPSKEYLDTALLENPLGLEGMVPVSVEEYYRQGHQTPWIWKPRDLEDDSASSNTNGSAPNQPRRHTDGDLSHQEPEYFTAKRDLQPTFSSKIVRTPEHYRHDSATSTPSPKRAASYSSIDSSLSSRMSALSTGSNASSSPTPLSRQSTMPSSSSSFASASTSFTSLWSASPTKHDFPPSSAPMLADQLSEEPDSILSPLVLSKTPLLSPSSLRTVRNHPNPLLATQSLDTIPEAASNHSMPSNSANNTARPPDSSYHQQQQQQQPAAGGVNGSGGNYYSTTSLQHTNSMPNPPKSQYVYPSNPPQLRLPPRNPDQDYDWERERDRDREEKERERELGIGSRHTTYVDPHFTNTTNTPSPRSRVSSRPSSRPTSAHPSPTTITPPTYPTSPPAQQYSQPQQQQQHVYPHPHAHVHTHPAYPSPSTTAASPSSHSLFSPTPSASSATTYTSASSRAPPTSANPNPNPSSNPLPPPPQMTQRAPMLPTPRTPPAHFQTRTRRGFWNRRGDFLTADGYIVYAPAGRAYPAELASYPDEKVGYQDHHKLFTAHVPRPELPQSLPRYGMPPECPYDAFIVYEYT